MIGFALMKMPRALNAAYERSPLVQKNPAELRRLRAVFSNLDPAAYRGVGRCPLAEMPAPDPGWIEATPPVTLSRVDEKARRRLRDMLGDRHQCDHYPCSVLPTLAQARELLHLVDRSQEYEIVRLSYDAPSDAAMLGYDVGYWGGGNYSILCDAVIWPVWHGPAPEAFEDLVRHLTCLNAHALFPDHDSAEQFRAFYLTQPWAETADAPSEFAVIRIEAVDAA